MGCVCVCVFECKKYKSLTLQRIGRKISQNESSVLTNAVKKSRVQTTEKCKFMYQLQGHFNSSSS